MRMITAAEGDMQRTGREAVVGKGALAGQEPRVLDALDPRADMLRAKCGVAHRFAAIARTARTMCS